MVEITKRIEELFTGKNVKTVLDEIGISQTTYYRSLKTNVWKYEHVMGIAKYFKVSMDYISFGDNSLTEWKTTAEKYNKIIINLLENERETKTINATTRG